MNPKPPGKLLFISIMLAAVSGCIAERIDLTRSGEIRVVTVDAVRTEVLRPSVYQEEDVLVVSGQVRRSATAPGAIVGHIHIEQVSSDGRVLQQATKALGMTSHRGRTRVASYTARLPWTLTPGSTFRVSLSSDEHTAD